MIDYLYSEADDHFLRVVYHGTSERLVELTHLRGCYQSICIEDDCQMKLICAFDLYILHLRLKHVFFMWNFFAHTFHDTSFLSAMMNAGYLLQI